MTIKTAIMLFLGSSLLKWKFGFSFLVKTFFAVFKISYNFILLYGLVDKYNLYIICKSVCNVETDITINFDRHTIFFLYIYFPVLYLYRNTIKLHQSQSILTLYSLYGNRITILVLFIYYSFWNIKYFQYFIQNPKKSIPHVCIN